MIAAWIILGVIVALPFLIPEFESEEQTNDELGMS